MSTRVADLTDREQQLVRDGYQVKPRVATAELRARYDDVLHHDVEIWVGTGWREIVLSALDQLAPMNVRVTTIREKLGGCQIIAYPRGPWRSAAAMHEAGDVTRHAWERSLLTCEVCGAPGTRNAGLPVRCRCVTHKSVI